MEAFAEIPHVADHLPFYKMKTEPSDKPEVQWIHGGFFMCAIRRGKTLPIIVEPERVFGQDTSFRDPESRHDIHGVACLDCHREGVPKKS